MGRTCHHVSDYLITIIESRANSVTDDIRKENRQSQKTWKDAEQSNSRIQQLIGLRTYSLFRFAAIETTTLKYVAQNFPQVCGLTRYIMEPRYIQILKNSHI